VPAHAAHVASPVTVWAADNTLAYQKLSLPQSQVAFRSDCIPSDQGRAVSDARQSELKQDNCKMGAFSSQPTQRSTSRPNFEPVMSGGSSHGFQKTDAVCGTSLPPSNLTQTRGPRRTIGFCILRSRPSLDEGPYPKSIKKRPNIL
jgi:hypothetical protein